MTILRKNADTVFPAVEGTISGMENVKEALREIETKCEDFNIERNSIQYKLIKNDDVRHNGFDAIYLVINGRDYFLRYHALHQLVELMKSALKANYVYQCLIYHKGDLALENLRAWEFVKKSKPFFVRAYDGEIRGLLTDKFADYQNQDVVNLVMDVLLSMDDSVFTVSDYEISEDIMKLYITEKMNLFSEFKFGFKIMNSEVGQSAVNARVFVETENKKKFTLSNQEFKFLSQKHVGDLDKLREKLNGYFKQVKVFQRNVNVLLKDASNTQIDFLEEGEKVIKAFELTKAQETKLNSLLNSSRPKTKLSMAEQLAELADMFPAIRQEFEDKAGIYLSTPDLDTMINKKKKKENNA